MSNERDAIYCRYCRLAHGEDDPSRRCHRVARGVAAEVLRGLQEGVEITTTVAPPGRGAQTIVTEWDGLGPAAAVRGPRELAELLELAAYHLGESCECNECDACEFRLRLRAAMGLECEPDEHTYNERRICTRCGLGEGERP